MAEDQKLRINRCAAAEAAWQPDEPGGRHLQTGRLTASGQAHHSRPRRRHQLRLRPVHQEPGRVETDPGQPGSDRAPVPGRLSRGGGDQPVRRRPRPVRHATRSTRSTTRCTRLARRRAGASTRCSSARMRSDADCECRKPKSGHDRRDRPALRRQSEGRAVGGRLAARPGSRGGRRRAPILVLTGKGLQTQADGPLPLGTRTAADLARGGHPRRG